VQKTWERDSEWSAQHGADYAQNLIERFADCDSAICSQGAYNQSLSICYPIFDPCISIIDLLSVLALWIEPSQSPIFQYVVAREDHDCIGADQVKTV